MNLYDVLRQLGYKVFLDQVGLKAGDAIRSRLQEGLRASQSGVLIWSNAITDSEWLEQESSTLTNLSVEKKDFNFVPITLDGSKLPKFLANRVYLDFSSYPEGPNGGELLRLLYAIVGRPLSREAALFALELDEAAQIAADKIGAAVRNGYPEKLLELAREGGLPWELSPALACKAAEGLTKLRRNDDAMHLLDSVCLRFPRAVRPKQLYALALARRGRDRDLEDAQEILGEMYERGQRDPETLGIYGRTWADRYAKSGEIADLRKSRNLYAQAFEQATDDYYTGINAAAKSVLVGDFVAAENYAARVQAIVGTEPRADDYWMTATIGELLLIRKHYADAARVFAEAVKMAPKETGSHSSTWKQVSRLMQKLNPGSDDRHLIRQAFAHLPDSE